MQTQYHQAIAEIARLCRLALPLALSQLAIMGMGVTDIILAGRASTDDLAGVSLGNAIFNLPALLVMGTIMGNGPIIGQYFGAANYPALRQQFQNCLRLALPLGLFAVVAIVGGMGVLAYGLAISRPVAGVALHYLLPMLGTVLLVPFAVTFRTTLEGLGHTRPSMLFNLAGFIINIPLDYALVFGRWGFPALGGAGCGWATLIVLSATVLCFWAYTRVSTTLANLRLLNQREALSLAAMGETLRVGLPIGGSILAEASFFILIPLWVAHLGPVVVSGHTAAMSFDWMMFMLPLGIAQAIAIRTAHEVGAHQGHNARRVCLAGMGLVIGVSLVQVLGMLLFRQNIAALYSSDKAVIALASQLLLYAATYRLLDAIQIGATGGLRGYKDTRIILALNLLAFWVVGFPLSYSLALTDFWGQPWGVEGFWMGMVVSISISAVLATVRLHYTSHALSQRLGPPPEWPV